jgi:peptidoglycan/LPS O-acetylase OafA/YrhL
MKQRLEYIDVFRGIAIVSMIFFQIFDRFSIKSIYNDFILPNSQFNLVTIYPCFGVFTFVVGMSVVLLLNKFSALSKRKTFWNVTKRYGKYVLLSIPFTWFMFGLSTYLGWEEAIQGLGLTAIVTAAILLFKPKNKHLLALIFGVGLLQIGLFSTAFSFHSGVVVNFIESMLWRGWFSVTHLLPFMLAGVLFFNLIRRNKPKTKILALALIFTITAIALHFAGIKLDFYSRTFSCFLLGIGEPALIILGAYALWQKFPASALWKKLAVYGQLAFGIYVGHFLFIIKPLELLHIADSFSILISLVLTTIAIISVYFVSKFYEKFKENRRALSAK